MQIENAKNNENENSNIDFQFIYIEDHSELIKEHFEELKNIFCNDVENTEEKVRFNFVGFLTSFDNGHLSGFKKLECNSDKNWEELSTEEKKAEVNDAQDYNKVATFIYDEFINNNEKAKTKNIILIDRSLEEKQGSSGEEIYKILKLLMKDKKSENIILTSAYLGKSKIEYIPRVIIEKEQKLRTSMRSIYFPSEVVEKIIEDGGSDKSQKRFVILAKKENKNEKDVYFCRILEKLFVN